MTTAHPNEAMIRAFEGEELEPTYDYQRRAPTRSSFERVGGLQGFPSVSANTPFAKTILTAADDEIIRVKRLQIRLLVPKAKAGETISGMFGVLRVPYGLDIATSELGFPDPALLRPILFHANEDHATYWEYFLTGLNLAGRGAMDVFVKCGVGFTGNIALNFTYRYVHERTSGGNSA